MHKNPDDCYDFTGKKISPPNLIICGAGIGGIMAAMKAADAGMSVVIIEKRSYPAFDIAAYNHSFIHEAAGDADRLLRQLPPEIQRLFSMRDSDGDIIIPEGFARQCLLNIIENRNIKILFEAEPVAASVSNGLLTGLMISCPVGLCWLPGHAVIDATERNNLARLLYKLPYMDETTVTVHSVFEMEIIEPVNLNRLREYESMLSDVAKELDILRGTVKFHSAIRKDTAVIEFAFTTQPSGQTFTRASAVKALSEKKCLNLARRLRETVTELKDASLSHIAYECHITSVLDQLPKKRKYSNLKSLSPLPWYFTPEDVNSLWDYVQKAVTRRLVNTQEISISESVTSGLLTKIRMNELELTPCNDDALGIPLYKIAWSNNLFPRYKLSSDVFVAGIGTGGSMAMLAAAEHGCQVTAVETHTEPGGTFGPGRVIGYYGGYRGGATGAYIKEASSTDSCYCNSKGQGGLPFANFIRDNADKYAVTLLTGSRVCGTRLHKKTLKEVLVSNEEGLIAVEAKVTIDTTGNADIAALAGANCLIGDPRDGMMQSFSTWGTQAFRSDWLTNRFLADPDIIRPDIYSERIRAVFSGHRGNSYNHIAPFFTIRESRRIVGDDALTMNDILNRRIYDNVIAVATTSTDSHAHLTTDLVKVATIGEDSHIKVRIPFGCFIPKGLEGLLVAAKSISGERDATCYCRMNADILNEGYAVGIAAAMAATTGSKLRNIDIKELQAKLLAKDILPDWAFKPEEEEWAAYSPTHLSNGKLESFGKMLSAQPEKAIKVLEKRYAAITGEVDEDENIFSSEKALIAMALAWYGSKTGNDYLVYLLRLMMGRGMHKTVPHIRSFRTAFTQMNDIESDFLLVNRMLIIIGRASHPDILPFLKKLVSDTQGLGEPVMRTMPYDQARKDVPVHPFYRRLINIAYAVERHADPCLVPAMESLFDKKDVSGHAVPVGTYRASEYMLAHLELSLARAAARCGSTKCAGILIDYLSDCHIFFRKNARKELTVISGHDFGKHPEPWRNWLNNMTICKTVKIKF